MNLDLVLVNIVLPDLKPSSQVVDPKASFTPSPKILFDVLLPNSLVTKDQEFHFITPHGGTESLYYDSLIYSLDAFTWLGFALMTAGISAGTWLVLAHQQTEPRVKPISGGNSLLLFITSILEQGVAVIDNPAQLISLYFLFTPWLLASLVIVNGYKSLLTTTLTLPKRVTLVRKFDDLRELNYSILTEPSKAFEKVGRDKYLKNVTYPMAEWTDIGNIFIALMELNKNGNGTYKEVINYFGITYGCPLPSKYLL